MVQMKQMRENALPRSASGRPRGTLSMEAPYVGMWFSSASLADPALIKFSPRLCSVASYLRSFAG
jgi:hypothetical protein